MTQREIKRAANYLFNSCGRLSPSDEDDIKFVIDQYECEREQAIAILQLVDDMMIEMIYGY